MSSGITAVEGIELGHHTLAERPTGCTVILARQGAVGGVDVRGSAPGTRETALLDPVNMVEEVHAVVLSGGSAFGLDAASGVMRYLDEQGLGYRVGDKVVPIVVSAILYDLGLEGDRKIRPGPDCGYQAAAGAGTAPPAEGSVGAGAGATVGKLRGSRRAMRGGFGTASITLPGGLTVAAAVAVNAVGDVVDPATGQGGGRGPHGRRPRIGRRQEAAAVRGRGRRRGRSQHDHRARGHQRHHDQGPGHEGGPDGAGRPGARDLPRAYHGRRGHRLFAGHRSIGGPADVTLVGALAADVMPEAILRAVRAAEGLPGLPAVRDLGGG